MSAKITLHVGAHKTGTSLIQKYMRDKPEQLASFGVRVISRSDTNTLIGWGKTLIDRPQLLSDRLDVESADPSARYIIASHENTLGRPHLPSGDYLYPESATRVAALAGILRDRNSRVIMYLRPQASFLESYYLQLVQQGESFTFDQWLDRVDFDRLSWRPVVDSLRASLGPDRVAIGDFEEIRAGQELFLAGFFHRIDPAIIVKPEYSAATQPEHLRQGPRGSRWPSIPTCGPPTRRSTCVPSCRSISPNAAYPRPVLFSDQHHRGAGGSLRRRVPQPHFRPVRTIPRAVRPGTHAIREARLQTDGRRPVSSGWPVGSLRWAHNGFGTAPCLLSAAWRAALGPSGGFPFTSPAISASASATGSPGWSPR